MNDEVFQQLFIIKKEQGQPIWLPLLMRLQKVGLFAQIYVQLDNICRPLFLLVHNFGVYLGSLYIRMPQHLADRVDVRTACELQRRKGVAEAMESYLAGNARSLYPPLQRSGNPRRVGQ